MTTSKPNEEQPAEHHPQPAPNEHLCTCGRYREDCLRDTLRDLWDIVPDPK